MQWKIIIFIPLLTGCSVVERLLEEPEIVAPVVEAVGLAVAAPSLITITNVLVALSGAVAGVFGLGCAKKLKKNRA